MSYALGVDIGTTFSAAAVYRQGRAEMVSLGYRSALVPSAVLITSTNETLVGDAALRRGQSEPERLARFFKRRIGDSVPLILGGSPLSSETLTARLLRAVVDQVVEQQGTGAGAIAVTRPANWGPFKQDRFDQALRLADLRDVTVLTEPEAAALAYAAEERIEPGAVVAVYDLGGGTFDATVLRRTGDRFEVIGEPEGIERLGGIDFDAAVFEHVRQSLYGAIEALDDDDPVTLRSITRLRNECIDAKEALSSDTQVSIPVVLPGLSTEVRLTRAELEAMIRPSLDDSIAALRRAVASAGVEPSGIDRVLLVGGSSRIPLVAQMVASAFGRPVALDAHPKHAVALGAALVAGGEGIDGRAIGATEAVPATVPPGPTAPSADPGPGEPPGEEAATGTNGSGLAAAGVAGAAAAVAARGVGTDEAGAGAGAEPAPAEAASAVPVAEPEAPLGPGDQPFAPVAFESAPTTPHEAPISSDGSLPAAPPASPGRSGPSGSPGPGVSEPAEPPAPPSGEAWAPPSGDTWAPPSGPDAPTRIDSGDAWAPAASASGPAIDDTQVESGDTWVTPTTPGPSDSGDAWPASDDSSGGRRSGVAGGLAAGTAIGAGAAAAGAPAAGASPAYAETAYAETASASGPAAPPWSPDAGGPASGSYPPGGGPAGTTPPSRKWLVPAAAAVAAVALGVGGFMAFANGEDDPEPEAGSTSDTTAASQTDTTSGSGGSSTTVPPAALSSLTPALNLQLPHGGDGVALDGDGRLWVATLAGGADQLVRFDTPDGADPGRVDIPLTEYGDDAEPLAVTYAFDSIWVTLRRGGKTLRIDPSLAGGEDPGVIAVYSTPDEPAAVVASRDYVWVVSSQPDGGTSGQVHRLDPEGSDAETVTAQVADPRGVLVDDQDRVWVTHGSDQLQEFSLDLEEQGGPIRVGARPDELAFANGFLWTANRESGNLSQVDPDERTQLAQVDVGGNPAGIRADGQRLWVTDTAEDGGDGRLILLDATTGEREVETPLGPRPMSLDVVEGTDSVWVTLFDQENPRVIRVDGS